MGSFTGMRGSGFRVYLRTPLTQSIPHVGGAKNCRSSSPKALV